MDYTGMDRGERESQIAILTEDGELIGKQIRTTREPPSHFLGDRPNGEDPPRSLHRERVGGRRIRRG